MGTVTISGNNYAIYGTQAAAVIAMASGFDDFAVAFQNASATLQAQALVQATHMLDAQRWQGLPVTPPVVDVQIQWPRTGVVDALGNAVDSSSIPDKIIRAAYELAGMLLVKPTLRDAPASGTLVERVDAGPAGVRFFRPTLGITGRFETRIAELVNEYMGGAVGGLGSESYGTTDSDGNDLSSAYEADDAYDLTRSI